MKLGAERKKIAILAALLLIAAYFLYSNLSSSPDSENAHGALRPSIPGGVPSGAAVPAATGVSRAESSRRSTEEFRPSLRHKGGIDPNTIDPKLRLDLLAKVQSVEVGPAERNLFQFGAAAVPALPPGMKDRKILPGPMTTAAAGGPDAGGPPPSPPPPPITLKYYGYTAKRADGLKRAFFLDGEDIFVAAEGDLIKKRYKVVHIGTNSAEVEDIQFNHKQPLPLAEEAPG
jgi:hypothetical protein